MPAAYLYDEVISTKDYITVTVDSTLEQLLNRVAIR